MHTKGGCVRSSLGLARNHKLTNEIMKKCTNSQSALDVEATGGKRLAVVMANLMTFCLGFQAVLQGVAEPGVAEAVLQGQHKLPPAVVPSEALPQHSPAQSALSCPYAELALPRAEPCSVEVYTDLAKFPGVKKYDVRA